MRIVKCDFCAGTDETLVMYDLSYNYAGDATYDGKNICEDCLRLLSQYLRRQNFTPKGRRNGKEDNGN